MAAWQRSTTSAVDSLKTSQEELRTEIEGLLSRERMRRVRASGKTGAEPPNAHTNPAEWKAHMRAQRAIGASL